MKTKYRICLIMPKGYVHSLCFHEIAVLLKSSLNSIGIDCDYTVNTLSAERINVLLGYHLLRFEEVLRKYRYIPYQLEQLDAKEGWYSDNIRQLLENAFAVWDYSRENIEFLRRLNIEAKHLPIGYHEALELIERGQQKDIDIMFYGSVGDRRKAILDRLAGIAKVRVLFGQYGKQRDALISRSRIVLNVHYYGMRIFEAPRISYLLNNACFVVSETSPVNPYDAVELCMAPYDKIVETCYFYLSHMDEIERVRIDTHSQFKKSYPMVEFMKAVV
ncbi:hypothetical protein HZA56_02645 [Candidatus Poribacteria bacterium]|nr:hypothetical protein [Candidatus Poribacteria bacterium]